MIDRTVGTGTRYRIILVPVVRYMILLVLGTCTGTSTGSSLLVLGTGTGTIQDR